MEIKSAMKEEIETWRGIIKAIHDGHSCLSLEVQRLIIHLVISGELLCRKYGFDEMLDADLNEHDAIAMFEALYGPAVGKE